MNGQIKRGVWLVLLSLSLQVIWPCALIAGEMVGKSVALDISNIGFMESPPKELRERFPICDAFLKVEWISKEKGIGRSQFELYKGGHKDGVMKALIFLNTTNPMDRIELYEFEKKGELEKLLLAIQKGEISMQNVPIPVVKYQSYKAVLQTHNTYLAGYSYAEGQINVCIPYPDNQRMWLVEGRKVGKVFTALQIEERYEKLKLIFPGMLLQRFKDANVIDLNFDGIEDYCQGDWFIYSSANTYFPVTRTGYGYKFGVEYSEWTFQPLQNRCELSPDGSRYLTTEGGHVFLNNQCDLTKLINQGK